MTDILGIATLVLIRVYRPTELRMLLVLRVPPTWPLLFKLFVLGLMSFLVPCWFTLPDFWMDPPLSWNELRT